MAGDVATDGTDSNLYVYMSLGILLATVSSIVVKYGLRVLLRFGR
jgi:hypothetical protein